MSAMNRYAMIAATSLALAACGDDPAPSGEQGEENLDARGEVLGGTISDDMLPLDTVTSQSPSQAEEAAAAVSDNAPVATETAQEEPAEPEAPADTGDDEVEPAE